MIDGTATNVKPHSDNRMGLRVSGLFVAFRLDRRDTVQWNCQVAFPGGRLCEALPRFVYAISQIYP